MKKRKKAWSILLAVALIFTTLFGNYSVKAATVHTLDNDNENVKEFTIHMKRPFSSASGASIYGYGIPNLYSYYRIGDQTKELSKAWPGDEMYMESIVEDGVWYSTTYTAPTDKIRIMFLTGISEINQYDDDGNFIGIDYQVRDSFPEDNGMDGEDNGFLISEDVWFDPLTMEEPVYKNPDITPTPDVSETPTVTTPTETPQGSTPEPTPVVTDEPVSMPTTEPITGPQVIVDYPSGTTYYQEVTDYLDITITPAYGATSAEISVDNGPLTTITKPTKIKVGTGKIANSMVTMTVTSTDGTTTNTQHFYYYKRTKVETPSQADASKLHMSSAMVTLFQKVKTAANDNKFTYQVNFTIPDESKLAEDKKVWTAKDSKIYAYAYYNIYNEAGEVTKVEKPLDVWPGTKMTAVEGKNGTYTTKVNTTTGKANLMFVCVKGEVAATPTQVPDEQGQLGEPFRVCQTIAQYPSGEDGEEVGGYTITGDKDFYADTLSTPTPTSSPEPSPEVSETPVVTDTTTPPASQTPIVTDPTETPTATPEMKELTGYFGASLAGPQYTTTKLTLVAVGKHIQGTATYSFAINGTIVADNVLDPVYTWDASQLRAGNYTLTAIITDSATNKSITLDKIYPLTEKTEAGDITPEPIIPTETPVLETSTVTPTDAVTSTSTVTPTEVATSTPNDSNVTTSPAIMTNTPIATATTTVTSTAIATEPAATATPIPTEAPIAPATQAPIVGKISFSKGSNKATAGETVQIIYSQKNEAEDQDYTFTYKIKKGSKTTTLKSNTSKDRVNWTPASSGTYQATVLAYDEAKNVVCTTTTTYKVKKRVITLKSFQPKTVKKGKKITVSVRATATTGSLRYKVVIKNSKGKTVKSKAYSKKHAFIWKPSAKGTYKATIYLKNGKGVTIVVTKTIKVK